MLVLESPVTLVHARLYTVSLASRNYIGSSATLQQARRIWAWRTQKIRSTGVKATLSAIASQTPLPKPDFTPCCRWSKSVIYTGRTWRIAVAGGSDAEPSPGWLPRLKRCWQAPPNNAGQTTFGIKM
ncbi:hypothetical protein KCP70_01400 [Salmonella enterica subsp. enterica]|nr:hypothetical protein KCP70_01400 [Salmonella enterica subsp. enterica]